MLCSTYAPTSMTSITDSDVIRTRHRPRRLSTYSVRLNPRRSNVTDLPKRGSKPTMTSLDLTSESIPFLDGKIAIITGTTPPTTHPCISQPRDPNQNQTPCPQPIKSQLTHPSISAGGSSGIGLSTTNLLISKKCRTYVLDLHPPTTPLSSHAVFLKCDTTSWSDLVRAFTAVTNDPENRSHRKIDIAIANAGVSETVEHWLDDAFEDGGEGVLKEPVYKVLDVNLRGVLNFVKLAVRTMKMGGAGDGANFANGNTASGGSIVITSSATAYAPEQSLPVYSASKLAVFSFLAFISPCFPAWWN